MRKTRNRLLRTLLLLPLLYGLSACVSYYYPPLEGADAVYYAADDPGYATTDSGYYATVGYYPWWSMDYFYLGYGYRSSGLSFGISYGFPSYRRAFYPYHYPSWYYDPWYYSYWYAPVHHHYSWFGFNHHYPYWHNRYRGYYGGSHGSHYRGHAGHVGRPGHYGSGQYAGYGGRHGDHNHGPGPGSRNPREDGRPVPDGGSYHGTGQAVRRVSVAPGAGSTDRGMVIRQRDGGKWSRSRLEPVGNPGLTPVPATGAVRNTPPSRQAPSRYTDVRGDGISVRYPTGAKRSTPRTDPVTVRLPDASLPVSDRVAAPQPVRSYRLPEQGVVVRGGSPGKVAAPRLQPIAPGSAGPRPTAPVSAPPPARSAPVVAAPPASSGAAPARAQPPKPSPPQRRAGSRERQR